MRCCPVFAFIGAFALVASTFAQGGQGGLGGGVAGRVGEGDPFTRTHILTTGDRGEWPIAAKAGEVLWVTAQSTSFDPALQIVDSAGKVLAENDDVRPGEQNPILLFRFPAAGEYKVLVKGYKAAGGGQYQITMRRFQPKDAELGKRLAVSLTGSSTGWVRIPGRAGQTLVLTVTTSKSRADLELLAPDGQRIAPIRDIYHGERTGRPLYQISQSGDHYLRVTTAHGSSNFAVTASAARELTTRIGTPNAKTSLESGGVDIWTFDGKAGDAIRADAVAAANGVFALLSFAPGQADQEDEEVNSLATDAKTRGQVAAVLRKTGKYQLTVFQDLGLATPYALRVQPIAKAWPGESVQATLAVGKIDYWSFEGKKGQVVRLDAIADALDSEIVLYNELGEIVERNDDGAGGRNSSITTLLPDDGRYLLAITSHGQGGSGNYTLKRSSPPLRLIAEDQRAEGVLGNEGIEYWSLSGKAGQTIVLSARSAEVDTGIQLIGPDGVEIAQDIDEGDDNDSLINIRLPLTGTYTIRVAAKRGSGRYIIRWLDLDR